MRRRGECPQSLQQSPGSVSSNTEIPGVLVDLATIEIKIKW